MGTEELPPVGAVVSLDGLAGADFRGGPPVLFRVTGALWACTVPGGVALLRGWRITGDGIRPGWVRVHLAGVRVVEDP